MSDNQLRILFIMRHSGYMGNFKALINSLASRGHHIEIAYDVLPKGVLPNNTVIQQIFDQNKSNITIRDEITPKRDDIWKEFVQTARIGKDYLRYFDDRYKDAPKLRKRAESSVSQLANMILKRIGNRFIISLLRKYCDIIEYLTPSAKNVNDFIQKARPDIILLTPYFSKGANQLDIVKSAQASGIKTALCVASWDNLTNKGLIQVKPHKVIVWNRKQMDEAVKMHGLNPKEVIITGAYNFDKWFERGPSRSKTEFCANAGLDADSPYAIYLGSSPFIAPREVPFVRRWIEAVRNSSEEKVRGLGILIRPHPQNTRQWEGISFEEYGNVSIFPQKERSHVTAIGEDIFYDSIYHSSLVVGLNTTAMIEAGILQKPVLTISDPEFNDTQEGTLHFRYLVNGGLLFKSKDFKGHCSQISFILNNKIDVESKLSCFIKDFVRPRGYDTPAIPIITDEIIKICADSKYKKYRQNQLAYIACVLLLPIVGLVNIRASFYKRMYSKKLHKTKNRVKKISRGMVSKLSEIIKSRP